MSPVTLQSLLGCCSLVCLRTRRDAVMRLQGIHRETWGEFLPASISAHAVRHAENRDTGLGRCNV